MEKKNVIKRSMILFILAILLATGIATAHSSYTNQPITNSQERTVSADVSPTIIISSSNSSSHGSHYSNGYNNPTNSTTPSPTPTPTPNSTQQPTPTPTPQTTQATQQTQTTTTSSTPSSDDLKPAIAAYNKNKNTTSSTIKQNATTTQKNQSQVNLSLESKQTQVQQQNSDGITGNAIADSSSGLPANKIIAIFLGLAGLFLIILATKNHYKKNSDPFRVD